MCTFIYIFKNKTKMATIWVVAWEDNSGREKTRTPFKDEADTQHEYGRMTPGTEYNCQKNAHLFTLLPSKEGPTIRIENTGRKAIFMRNKGKEGQLRGPGQAAEVSLKQPATLDLIKRHKGASNKQPQQPRRVLCSLTLFADPQPAEAGQNYLFYTGKGVCMPYGVTLEEIHKEWAGDYTRLEQEHGYIQWLFPLFVRSAFNSEAPALTRGEALLLRRDKAAAQNILASYKLMLDFYGLRLVDDATGEVGYAADKDHCAERMANLNRNGHNFLRITRILTSLGHLGFTRYKRPLLRALEDAVEKYVPRARDSLERFWKATVLYDSPNYYQSSKELPCDREPSVLFISS